jgi:hypothetical protein
VAIAAVCASQAAFYTYERALLPNACLATSIVADSGHAIQLEVAAPRANREFLAWLHATLSGRPAHCAVSGAGR